MKKVISLISSLALVISLSSCAIKETPIINGVEYKYNDQFYADTVDQLLTYIDDGDKDGVKSLLCNGLKNSDGIDADIQALIDGFEGDIIRTTEYLWICYKRRPDLPHHHAFHRWDKLLYIPHIFAYP